MTSLDLLIGQTATYVGIRPQTESGNPAKVYTDDAPLEITNESGDVVGTVTNFVEDAGDGGSSFDVVLNAGAAGASVVNLTADADADSGEVRSITHQWNVTVRAEEAAGFNVPEPVIS